MDEIVIKCDGRYIITVASIEDVPKFVTLIRASEGPKARPVETSTDTSDHPKTDEQTDEKNVE